MKRLLLAFATASALMAGTGAASAQTSLGFEIRSYDHSNYSDRYNDNYSRGYSDRAARLERRIDWAARRGDLSWREARYLRLQLEEVRRLERRFQYDGMSRWEARNLDQRYDAIRARLRFEATDNNRRAGAYGYAYEPEDHHDEWRW